MIKLSDPILVLGAGSIGERHIKILQKLGYQNIWVYRQRNFPLRSVTENSIQTFGNLDQIETIQPKAAFICTPTSQHLEQALFCTKHKIHVLIEKPLSNKLTGFNDLKYLSNNTHIQIAYMLRYHPFFESVKQDAETQNSGKLISMQSYWGEYLPDWHPWEDYRNSYAAKQEMGGGVSLTLSHDVDLLNWLSGSIVKNWHTMKNKNSSLLIDVESGSDISIAYENGVTGHCHLNFHEKIPRRWYRFVFENASIEIDYLKSELTTYSYKGMLLQSLPDFDRNELYELQTIDFFRQINEKLFPATSIKNLEESKIIISICQ